MKKILGNLNEFGAGERFLCFGRRRDWLQQIRALHGRNNFRRRYTVFTPTTERVSAMAFGGLSSSEAGGDVNVGPGALIKSSVTGRIANACKQSKVRAA
jgi:hypothetical protein